jgi:hypothetical protein
MGTRKEKDKQTGRHRKEKKRKIWKLLKRVNDASKSAKRPGGEY